MFERIKLLSSSAIVLGAMALPGMSMASGFSTMNHMNHTMGNNWYGNQYQNDLDDYLDMYNGYNQLPSSSTTCNRPVSTYHPPVMHRPVVKHNVHSCTTCGSCNSSCVGGNYNYGNQGFGQSNVLGNADTGVNSYIHPSSLNAIDILGGGGFFGTSNVDADANTNVDSVINAPSMNDISIHQGSGLFNQADVNADANSMVNSDINAPSINDINVSGGNSWLNNNDVNANATTNVDSVINAPAMNTVDVQQSGGLFQTADVNANASSNVDSTINAGSANVINVH